MRVKDRIRAFMRRYDLTYTEMAELLCTPRGTLSHWLRHSDKSVQPPGCMEFAMDVLERFSEVRDFHGLVEYKDE